MTEALTRPVCTATIATDDTVTVAVDGVDDNFPSMTQAISHLAAIAGHLHRPLRVTALDHSAQTDQEMVLVVREDETVEQQESVGKKRSAQPVSLQSIEESVDPHFDDSSPGDVEDHSKQNAVGDECTDSQYEGSAATSEPRVTHADPAQHEGPAATSEPRVTHADPAIFSSEPASQRLRPEAASQKPDAAAREGWKGWINSTFKTSLSPSHAEQESRQRRTRIQQPLETHRTAAVVELKGGAGKTTTAYHIAATFGRCRGGNILVGEFNENQGTLAERALAGEHERTTLDLIRNLGTVTRKTRDLVRYVRPQGDDRIHVLASPPEGADRSRVAGDSVKLAHEMLLSLYSLILLDTGNSAQSSTWQAAVDVADSLIFVAHNREDDCRLLEASVRAVQAGGFADKMNRSMLVVSSTAHPNEERLERLKEYATAIGLAQTVVIPFDPSLQEGRDFDYDALNWRTRDAYEEATAALADQL